MVAITRGAYGECGFEGGATSCMGRRKIIVVEDLESLRVREGQLTATDPSAMLAHMSAPTDPLAQPTDLPGKKAATQQNRPIRIDIAGGNPDELLLYEVEVREELGRPYEITVKMQSQEPSPPVSAGNVLGKEATIRMETEDSSRPAVAP